jgi:hypothetical protein
VTGDPLEPVPWWEWAEGKRPAGWTAADEQTSRFSGLLPDAEPAKAPPAPKHHRQSRVHVVFDEHGEVSEYELGPSPESARRQWAAMMLALDVYVCDSILSGRPGRAGRLDWQFLERALRGSPLPDAETFLLVTDAMLEAVAEAGPLPEEGD